MFYKCDSVRLLSFNMVINSIFFDHISNFFGRTCDYLLLLFHSCFFSLGLCFQSKIVRVLNLWQKNAVFKSDIIQPLLDMAAGIAPPIVTPIMPSSASQVNNTTPGQSKRHASLYTLTMWILNLFDITTE